MLYILWIECRSRREEWNLGLDREFLKGQQPKQKGGQLTERISCRIPERNIYGGACVVNPSSSPRRIYINIKFHASLQDVQIGQNKVLQIGLALPGVLYDQCIKVEKSFYFPQTLSCNQVHSQRKTCLYRKKASNT